jgi:hypothetical protein
MFYGAEISPIGWDENGIGVWWGEQKIALAAPSAVDEEQRQLSLPAHDKHGGPLLALEAGDGG